jgi:hypothetical protein
MKHEALIARLREEATYDLNHQTIALLLEAAQALAAPVQKPVSMRMPKVGDRVVCIEDESLGTVVYLTAGGSPEINFDDGSHGTYMLREFAELFGYTTPPAAQPAPVQAPVAWANPNDLKNFDLKVRTNGGPLHTVPLCLCTPPAAQPAPVQAPVAYAVYHRMGGGKSLHWPEQHSENGDANEYELVPLYTTPPAQPTVPDAIHHTDMSETLEYIQGWNDCRSLMLKSYTLK